MQQQILTSLTTDELQELIYKTVSEALQASNINDGSPEQEILNVNEVASLLKVSKHTIYRRTHENTIPHHKVGGKLYFYRSEIEEYLARGKQLTQEEFEVQARKKLRKN